MPDNPFIGTWRLISFVSERENGEITYPYGEDASGYITYGADGYMSVALMSANRPHFTSDRSRAGKTEDKAASFDGYISYAGPYTVGEDAITHHVEVAWFPNMVGQREGLQTRRQPCHPVSSSSDCRWGCHHPAPCLGKGVAISCQAARTPACSGPGVRNAGAIDGHTLGQRSS